MSNEKKNVHSRRYGKRFSNPYGTGNWTNGHRHNPARKRRSKRRPAAVVVKGKA